MPLGLDKTHKKEKKDRRFAQFNLILGAAADAGKREFNFTTREYKRRTRDQVSQRFLKQSRDCRRRRRLRSIFVALRPHGGHGGHLYLKKREREREYVLYSYKFVLAQMRKIEGKEREKYLSISSKLVYSSLKKISRTNLHCLH